MNLKQTLSLAGAAALLVGAAACSEDAPDAPEQAVEQTSVGPVDTTIFERAGGVGDALVFKDPAELAALARIVASGEVVGFADGYELLEHGSATEGYDIRDYTVVMQVKVTELYKGSKDDLDSSGSIYLTLSRGATQEGVENDEPGRSTITPIGDFEEAIPIGSEVVVMATEASTATVGNRTDVIDWHRGVPDGSVLLDGGHPQVLAFATPNGGNTAWAGSLDEVRRQLDERF